MPHATQQFSTDTLLRLAEAGFLACDMGLREDAMAIFSGLASIQPAIPHPVMNQAIVDARFGNVDRATDTLHALLGRFPDSQIVKAMLGLFMVQQNDSRAKALLDEVLQRGDDADAVAVARSCYELASEQQPAEAISPLAGELQFFRHYNSGA